MEFYQVPSPLRVARAKVLTEYMAAECAKGLQLDDATFKWFAEAGWTREQLECAVDDVVAFGWARIRPSLLPLTVDLVPRPAPQGSS
jgi:hypothetical protein